MRSTYLDYYALTAFAQYRTWPLCSLSLFIIYITELQNCYISSKYVRKKAGKIPNYIKNIRLVFFFCEWLINNKFS